MSRIRKSKTNTKHFQDITKPPKKEKPKKTYVDNILKVTYVRNDLVQERVKLLEETRAARKRIYNLTNEIMSMDEMINKSIVRFKELV